VTGRNEHVGNEQNILFISNYYFFDRDDAANFKASYQHPVVPISAHLSDLNNTMYINFFLDSSNTAQLPSLTPTHLPDLAALMCGVIALYTDSIYSKNRM